MYGSTEKMIPVDPVKKKKAVGEWSGCVKMAHSSSVHVMSCEKPLGCLFNVFFFLLSSL